MTSQEAVFIGCNKELQIADYNQDLNLVAFGSRNTISIFNPINPELEHKGILANLKSHKSHVISVKFIPNTSKLVSTSEDKTIKIWSYDETNKTFELEQTLDEHDSSVTSISVVNEKLIVSGSATGELKFWRLVAVKEDKTEYQLCHTLKIKDGFYQLSLTLVELFNGEYLLFIGGTSPLLYVYSVVLSTDNENGNIIEIHQSAVLSGHEDWIKAIALKKENDSEYLIATGSQDRYIRLWKLRLNDKIDNSDDQDKTKLRLLSNKQYKFDIVDSSKSKSKSDSASPETTTKCSISFDAIIMGHDDWISSLVWHPTETRLLSSSSDTSIMIWEPDTTSGIWISKNRLGEMSIKGASTATGASGGFWCSLWVFDKDTNTEMILTNGKTGSFRCWKKQINSSGGEVEEEEEETSFVQKTSLTGPMKDVTDLQWSNNGDYLLATSLDQTTRLFAKWTKNADGSVKEGPHSWHEFARPQIHGYDMICIKPISDSRFVSAGDEKILRSFDEPRSVAQLLTKFTDAQVSSSSSSALPESASLPVLGLSNKAELDDVEQQHNQANEKDAGEGGDNDNDNADDDEEGENGENGGGSKLNISANILSKIQSPPLEDHLQRHTLWPEIEKLYGHGFEITTLDVSPDKLLIASACRSNVASHAVIRIFRTDTWFQLPVTLPGHELTITRVRFSPCGKYLLSVSRDRQFSIWERKDNLETGEIEFELVLLKQKAHSRIVWDCCFLNNSTTATDNGDVLFVTGSRDKYLKLWKRVQFEGTGDEQVRLVGSIKLDTPITSLDSYCKNLSENGKSLISVGFEDGGVSIYQVGSEASGDGYQFELVEKIDPKFCPSEKVSRVSFSSKLNNDGKIQLAVGSVDHSIRLLSLDLK